MRRTEYVPVALDMWKWRMCQLVLESARPRSPPWHTWWCRRREGRVCS